MEENNVQNVAEEVQEPLPKGMKKCKTCGAAIAKNAKRCPSCGAKNKKPIYKRIWFWILAIAVIAGIATSLKRAGLDVKKPEFKVTADQILKEFFEGEEKGNSKYKNKVVAITGKVGSIQEDYIRIDAFAELSTLFSIKVIPADKSDIGKVTKDSVITVSGICNGKILGGIELEKAIIDSSLATNPDYGAATSVQIDTLMNDYKTNKVSADEKYWGKTIQISGKVSYVADTSNYVVLVPEGQEKSLDAVLDGITVYFEDMADFNKIMTDSGADKYGNPTKTINITIAGVCYGEAFGYDAQVCRAKLK